MSKIGRKRIPLNSVKVEVNGQTIQYNGQFASGVHEIPTELGVDMDDTSIGLIAARQTRDTNRLWGLHRALLAGKIGGAHKLFEKQVRITGLGFKAIAQGKKIEFTLGYSHKIYFDLPDNVVVDIDKTGQVLTVKSANKQAMGDVCGKFRAFRPTEPYKGTGILVAGDLLIRKAGKGKGK